jgi:glucose/mannose-6-phosphate isomerase
MIDDVLAIPEHLRDARWRIESARLQPADAAGLLVCGMGGSAIGADLAVAALGDRLTRPMVVDRGYTLPSWVGADWTVLCSSYSGHTEETLSCFDAAVALGVPRTIAGTGGPLVERAREAGDPVVGLPGIFQPRAAVAYMFTVAIEAAVLCGAAPRIDAEIEVAAAFLAEQEVALQFRATEIATLLDGAVPVFYGAGLTVPVARRWKTQANENAKVPSFYSEIPEADHNELCGWNVPAISRHGLAAVFLEDRDQHRRERLRFELTAAAVSAAEATVVRVESAGETRVERTLWTTMLGDLVSLELARMRDVDPVPVEAIDSLKQALEREAP